VLEDRSLVALFWAPFIEYNVAGLQKTAGFAVDQAVGLALVGEAEERAYEGFGPQFAAKLVRDMHERSGTKNAEP
jgi:hypothetical protein